MLNVDDDDHDFTLFLLSFFSLYMSCDDDDNNDDVFL